MRADQLLVTTGLARSRALARTYITAGRVLRGTVPVRKASEQVPVDAELVLIGEPEHWVGRAAYKLVAAIDVFGPAGLAIAGRRCLDVGASTGGFTQVLLEHGAESVTALDVGHGQLVAQIASDPRVTDLSGKNMRDVAPGDLGEPYDLVVSDLSFISLTVVMGQLAQQVASDGDLVVLVKPQFEVGRERLGRTGVVRSTQQRAESVRGVVTAAERARLRVHGLADSPMAGSTGNREYLLWLRFGSEGMMSEMDLSAHLDRIAQSDDA